MRVDGSDSSLQALDEATSRGPPLRLVYTSLRERYEGGRPSFTTDRASEEIMAEDIAESCAERALLRNPEPKVSESSAAVWLAFQAEAEAEARGCALHTVRARRRPAHGKRASPLLTEALRASSVARWRGGAVARWRGGAVARWRGGAVARWRGGAVAR
ncbi:hypothetical protein [Streptomyces avermitilis]